MEHVLWTFQVTSPTRFYIPPKGNPAVYHSGGMSVFHYMLTQEQADQLENLIRNIGVDVHVNRWQAVSQTREQQEIRHALLGVGRKQEDFPSPVCASCYWFDPTSSSICGRLTWPPETITASLDSHEAARTGQADCPVYDWG